MTERQTDLVVAPTARFAFHVGDRIVSENTLRHLHGGVGIDVRTAEGRQTVPVRADLELWEYIGSLRYDLSTGALQPFLRAGYGPSWYRLGWTIQAHGLGLRRDELLAEQEDVTIGRHYIDLGVRLTC